jgi:hypothetical protein
MIITSDPCNKLFIAMSKLLQWAKPYNTVLIIDYCRAEPFPCPLAQSAVENIGPLLSGTQAFSEKFINQYIFLRVCGWLQ